MKVRKLSRPRIEEAARGIIGDLGVIEALAEAVSHANDHLDDGRQGVSYEGARRPGGSEDWTPTERAALQTRHDTITDTARSFLNNLDAMRRLSRDARREAGILASCKAHAPSDDDEKRANQANAPSGSGDCQNPNCKRLVSGSRVDRLRKGRCEACARYYTRHETERPRELCQQGLEEPVCGAGGWFQGVEQRCTFDADHDGEHSWIASEIAS